MLNPQAAAVIGRPISISIYHDAVLSFHALLMTLNVKVNVAVTLETTKCGFNNTAHAPCIADIS